MLIKKLCLQFIVFAVIAIGCSSSSSNKLTVNKLEDRLNEISSISNDKARQIAADSLWNTLRTKNQIPFRENKNVVFLYRGKADSVSWNGDFNSWSGNKSFKNEGTRVKGTDIWMLKTSFPEDARLDYKVVVDGNWMLDPHNPHQQWSGFGPNSELRMPKWEAEPLTNRITKVEKGVLGDDLEIESGHLSYTVQYRLYTPPNYQNLSDLPALYVLDGQEYLDNNLGALVIMLDNLIYLDEIEPIIVVFIDPRNPKDQDINRRANEFGINPDYADFMVYELIPEIESNYKASTNRENRALLGTSLGGLNTTYLGFKHPDIFGKLAIQAPAYWYKEKEIYSLVRGAQNPNLDIYMSVGTIGDNINDARRMKAEFEKLNLDFTYLEVNEGHSWGAWSAQTDDILIQFFKK